MPQQLDLSKFQPSLDLSKFQLDTSKFEQPKENWWDWLMKKPITTVPGMLYQLSAGISQPKSVSEFGAGNINSLFTPANIALTAMSGGAYGLGRMGLTTGASVLNNILRASAVPITGEGLYRMRSAESPLEFAGGGLQTALGTLGMRGATPRVRSIEPEVLPQKYFPLPEETSQITPKQQLLLQAAPELKLLPAIGETSITGEPRFYQGRAGIADATRDYPVDISDFSKLRGNAPELLNPEAVNIGGKPEFTRGTLLPSELGELGYIPPELVAQEGTGIFPRLWDPYLGGFPKPLQPSVFTSPGMTSSRTAPLTTLEQPLGGRAIQPPRTTSPYDPNRVDIINRMLSEPIRTQKEFPQVRTGQVEVTRPGLKISEQNSQIRDQIKETVRNTGDDESVLKQAIDSGNPTLIQTARSYLKKFTDPLLASAGTRLKDIGGTELYRRSGRFTQFERFYLKNWVEPFKKSVMRLSRTEQENFGGYVEGKIPIPNNQVRHAVDAWKKAEQLAGKSAEDVGMQIELASGAKVPFKRIEFGYWPRRLSEKELAALPSKIDQMVAEGLSRDEAELIVRNARKFGELILPQQHQRIGKIFNYRSDALSGLQHLESMAKGVARTKEFGIKDIAGRGSEGIADLIETTSNPKLAYDIMRRIVGRDEQINRQMDDFVRGARTAVSWIRLQNYGISSIVGNQLPNMLRGNAKEYIKSLGTFLGRNRAITDKSAAAMDLSHGVFEQTSRLNPLGIYGGTLAENVVRGQAAGIGQGMAKTWLRELKANPNNQLARKELFELVMENPDDLIRQTSLTEEQLRMAAGRGSELSQGLTNPVNLPMWMSSPVNSTGNMLLQLSLIFKKQAAIQNKMIWQSFKTNPVKTTALLTGMSQIAGATIGGVKSALIGGTRAAISGRDPIAEIEEEYARRADYVGRFTGSENELLNRTIDRMLQSWALGLGSDILFIGLDGRALSEFMGGPVVSAGSDIFGNITNPTQLGREGLRMLPIPGGIGTGIQRELLPTQAQQRKWQ